MRDKLVDFMKWYKNTIPIGTLESSVTIVDKYLTSINEKEIFCDLCGKKLTYDPKFDFHTCYDVDCIIGQQIKI